jgi:hypothetical protein
LTGQPNVRFLIDTIETGSIEEIRREAVGILAPYMDQRFAAEGRPAEEADRETLIVTALDPGSARGGGLRSVPERSAVASVRTWKEFGLVELRFGEGPRGQSGYSMLFRQDQGRWVFVCLMKGWIS